MIFLNEHINIHKYFRIDPGILIVPQIYTFLLIKLNKVNAFYLTKRNLYCSHFPSKSYDSRMIACLYAESKNSQLECHVIAGILIGWERRV